MAVALSGSVVMAATTYAGSGEQVSAKGVMKPIASSCSSRPIQPLFSRYAQTSKVWTLRGIYRSFEDVEMQEIDEFDGWGVDLELTVPLNDQWQMRAYIPLHTEGDAVDNVTGEGVDVDGDGGTFDYASLMFDYQFKSTEQGSDWNMSAFFGVGTALNYLISTYDDTGIIDKINHRGAAFYLGMNMDRQLNDCWTLITNVGARYHWESDDLHPNDGSDVFWMFDASAAVVYAPQDAWIYPVLELVYQGTLDDYFSLQVVPQLILPIGEHVDVNAGVSLGLLDDGPSTEARVQMSVHF